MKNKTTSSEKDILRQKAEEFLKNKSVFIEKNALDIDIIRLVHELEVHQIELEMQNEELHLAKIKAEAEAEKYTNLYDFAPTGYFTLSNNGTIMELNFRGANLLGKERSQLLKKRFGLFASDETRPTFNLFLEEIFDSKTKQTCEIALSHAPLFVNLSGIISDDEKFCLLSMHDISKRKKAEEETKISEEKYHNLFETNRDSITLFRIDSEGYPSNFIEANQATIKLFGYTKKELLELNICQLETLTDTKVKARITNLMSHGKLDFETIIKTKKGKNRDVEIESILINYLDKPAVMNITRDITERKQNEENTRKAQENLATILVAIPDLLFEVDLEGLIYYYQGNRNDLLVVPPSEFMGKTFQEILPTKAANVCFEAMQEALDKGWSTGKQYSLDLPSGKCWFELSVSPINETGNTDPHFIMLVRDITVRIEAQEQLKNEKEQIKTILEIVGNPIFLKDNDHKITYANSSFYSLFGLNEKNVIGKTLTEKVPKNEKEHFLKIDRNVLDTGIPDIREEKLTVNGIEHTVITSKHRLMDESGSKSLVCSIYDITDRKQAETALQKSQEKLQGVFNVANSGIVMIDKLGNFLLFNDWCCKLLGYTRTEFQELNTTIISHPDDLKRSGALNKEIIEGKIDTYQIEKRYIRKDKSFIWCEVSASAIKDQDNNVVNIIGVITDITERKKAKMALQKSEARLIETQTLAKVGSWETDFTFKNAIWSRETARIYGIDEKATRFTLEEFLSIVHPEDRLLVQTEFVHSIKKHRLNRLEHRIITPSGIEKFIEQRWKIIRSPQGEPVHAIGSCHDITERKLSEELVEQSKIRFSSIINSSPIPIALNDEALNITYLNPAFVSMFGYTIEDIPTINDWFPKAYPDPDYRKKIKKIWIDSIERINKTKTEVSPIEVIIRCKNGKDKTVIVSGSPLLHFNNSEYLNNFYDITERKQAEEALKNEKQRLDSIIIATGAGTWEWNIETGETIYNEKFAETLGYTLDELTPTSFDTWEKLTHPDDSKYTAEIVEKHIQGKLDYYESTYRMKHKNGNWIWMLGRGKINKWDIDGKPLLMSGTQLDITERKLAEEKLIENERFLNQTQTIANLGSYSLDFSTGKWTSSTVLDHIFGIDESFDKTNEGWQKILHPDWRVNMNNYFNDEVIAKKVNFNKDYKIIKIDSKEERWVHGIGEIIFDNNGQSQQMIGSIQDITERKLVEEKLMASEKFLNQTQTITNLGSYSLDFTTGKWTSTAVLDNIFGIDTNFEKTIEGWVSIIHPDWKKIMNDYLNNEVIGKKANFNAEYKIIKIDSKEERWVHGMGEIIFNNEEHPLQLIGSIQDITKQKLAEETLRESEEKYRNLVENSPDGVVIYVENKIAYINHEGTRMLGAKNKEEIIGQSVLRYVHPDSLENIVQKIIEVNQENHASETIEEKFETILGVPFDVEIKAIPTFYEHKPAVQIIVHDITKRKQNALELNKINRVYALISQINNLILRTHNREELFQEICNIAVDFGKFRMSWIGLLNVDNHKIITTAFAGYENGYFTDSNVTTILNVTEGKGPTGIALREGRTVICNDIANDSMMKPWRKEALKRGYSSVISIPIIVRNKKIGNFNLYSEETNFFSSEEEISLLEKIVLNIAFTLERIQIEEERKLSEEKISQLSKAVEQSPVTIIITNTNGEIEYVNPMFVENTGYKVEEVLGKNIRLLKSVNTTTAEYEKLWETITNGKVWNGEFNNRRKNGSLYWESATIAPITNNEGITTHYIAIKENITERKIAEQELINAKLRAEESDRLKLVFLANMSHEIRTPMNGILGFTELLKEPKLTGEEQREYIDIIEKSGKRMLNIINDIISISKVESGQIEVVLSETNINEQINYIHTFFKPEAKQKGIQLTITKQLPSEQNIIKTDREKLYAILTNLLKNAIKFTNEGCIEFGCEKKGEKLECFVKDSGIGISDCQKSIIFERFRQANESVSRSHEGSGLGLAISKAYAEILGGQIWVESEEGKGSTFYFTIPYNFEPELQEKLEIEKTNSDVKGENKINNLKVLIVEDDAISKLLITIAVKPYSKEILKVSNGIEAIEACRVNPDINLVMMDINMPEMDGYEATKQIREFNKDLVIIAQTANGMQSDHDKAIESGCTDYISKPINIVSLSKLIHKYFNK